VSLLDEYPLTASADEDSALRLAIARRLAAQVYRVPGGVEFGGYVFDETPTPPQTGAGVITLACFPEWADGDTVARTPFAVILDATGTYAPARVVDDDTPMDDGGTLWTPVGDVAEGPAVTLRGFGEYEVTLTVLIQATDKPTRAALVRGARAALSAKPGEEPREGVIVSLGGLYYDRKARLRLLSLSRQDTEDSGGTKRRGVLLTIRASVEVVEPVEIGLIQHVAFVPPDAADSMTRVP